MKILRFILIASLVTVIITSCSYVSYKGNPDGSTYVSAYVIGTNKALSGFKADFKNGERSISVDKLDENQSEGLIQVNQGLKMIVEGLAKGAAEGVK